MRRGKLLRAFYYTALLENDDYSPIRPLVDWLNYNGFTMVTKPAKEYTDSQGRRKVKGNMDIELTVDAMELAPHVDHIVLFSGDGDFRPLVEALQRKGVRVSVVSTIRSQPPMIADELRRQADNFIELDELREVIGRPPREPRTDASSDADEVAPDLARRACPPLDLGWRPDLTTAHDQTTADPLSRRAARILRRRRPRHQDRRDGDREMGRAGLCPPRDRAQQVRRRRPARQGCGLCRGTGRMPA